MEAPVANPATTPVVTTQPTARPPRKKWHIQLCDMPHCPLMACSCCCPCFVFAHVADEIGHSYTLCCLAYFFSIFFVQLPINCCLGCMIRNRVRKYYNIHGNCLFDCCAYCCCYSCTLNQAAFQVEYERSLIYGKRKNVFAIRLGRKQLVIGKQPLLDDDLQPQPKPQQPAPQQAPACVIVNQPAPVSPTVIMMPPSNPLQNYAPMPGLQPNMYTNPIAGYNAVPYPATQQLPSSVAMGEPTPASNTPTMPAQNPQGIAPPPNGNA